MRDGEARERSGMAGRVSLTWLDGGGFAFEQRDILEHIYGN